MDKQAGRHRNTDSWRVMCIHHYQEPAEQYDDENFLCFHKELVDFGLCNFWSLLCYTEAKMMMAVQHDQHDQ